jgi:hypothetical protein
VRPDYIRRRSGERRGAPLRSPACKKKKGALCSLERAFPASMIYNIEVTI